MKFIYLIISFTLFTSSVSSAYTSVNGNIQDSAGQVVSINGINWSGFQDSGFIDELYSDIPFYSLKKYPQFGLIDMLTHPWENPGTGVDKQSGVAFKTIRLPIQPQNLTDNSENTHFRLDLTSNADHSLGNGPFCKSWNQQQCINGLSVSESLYRVIYEMKKNQVNVLVDIHQTPQGRTGNVITPNYSLHDYKNSIALLAEQLKIRHLTNVIGIDVFNEPHNLYWYETKGTQPAWIDVIATAATVVYKNNPDLLLFVEGPSSDDDPSIPIICIPKNNNTPQDPESYQFNENTQCNNAYQATFKSNWGENFKGLLNPAEAKKGNPVFDEERFRTILCKKTGLPTCNWLLGNPDDPNSPAHLVFSPHVYGKHVSSWQSTPLSSPVRFDYNWGFLINSRYPVVIGEAGYLITQQSDMNFFEESLMPYLMKKAIPNHLFYWTFNTNSGDTGGVRSDQNSIELVLVKEMDLHTLFDH